MQWLSVCVKTEIRKKLCIEKITRDLASTFNQRLRFKRSRNAIAYLCKLSLNTQHNNVLIRTSISYLIIEKLYSLKEFTINWSCNTDLIQIDGIK